MSESHEHCKQHDDGVGGLPGPGRNLTITGFVFVTVLLASFLAPFAALNDSLLSYLSIVWWAVLLGLALGGVIDYFVPDGIIIRFLGPRNTSSLFYAVIAGFLMSACSHGILALAIQLYKKGASVPAVITFLLASPWANLPMTFLLFSFFGLQAAWIVFAAMAIALTTGFAFTMLDRFGLIESASSSAQATDLSWSRLTEFNAKAAAQGIAVGAISLGNMVLWWILIGILMAAVIGAYVPEHWFMQYLGPDALGMALTLALATILEVCSEGTSPIAFEIFNKTHVLGNPFVFLMAGVATDYTEIGLLWTNVGRRTAIWLPVITVPQILLVGYLFNELLSV